MCNVRSPKPAESHLLFLIAAMSWLVLFVFYAPGMGLLQKGGDPFNDQNVFLAFYILTVLACMFIPGWYTTARYRALTLAGVAGTVFSAVGVALLMGVLRLGAVGLLGFFCGLFTFAGIVFVLMRLLPFKWQMGAIAFLVSINPLSYFHKCSMEVCDIQYIPVAVIQLHPIPCSERLEEQYYDPSCKVAENVL